MIIGSARLPRMEGIASFLHTRRLRRQTCTKRNDRIGKANKREWVIRLVPQVSTGELEENVLEIRRPVKVDQLGALLDARNQRLFVLRVAKRGLAGDLDT